MTIADSLLGYVLISTCVDGQYDREEIVELFESLDLDSSLVPDVAVPTDAFNKAVTANRTFKYRTNAGDAISISVDEVTSARPSEYIVRALVRKNQASKRSALNFDVMGDLTLYKAPKRGGRIDHSGARLGFSATARAALPEDVTDDEIKKIRGFVDDIRADYDRYRTYLDVSKIGRLVDQYLKKLGAVRLKDSVRFVPLGHGDEALRLCQAISSIGNCRLEELPLVDMKNQRQMIVRAFHEDTHQALTSLSAEIAKANEVPTPSKLARARGAYNDLLARSRSYEQILGEVEAHTASLHDVVRANLHTLSTAVAKKG